MRRVMLGLAATAAVACAPGLATAGAFTDDMSKCVVRSASAEDQKDLVIWIFSAISSHPAAAPYVNITDPQRDMLTRKAGDLMMRLLTSDCRKETISALKYEGQTSIQQAFGVLGQVAMQGLLTDAAVNRSMESLGEVVDAEKLGALFIEAGVVTSGEKKPK
jgi:hypothetical protein